jgi:hypothetical protein
VPARARVLVPGEAPREVPVGTGDPVALLPSLRASGGEAPGIVLEWNAGPVRVGGRRLPAGERWLLRPGEEARVGPARIVAAWDDPGTASAARAILRAALRGEAPQRGPVAVVLGGPLAGRKLRLRDGVLGRARDAAVRIDDPSVSRRHARLRVVGDRLLVTDLGSRNGSWRGRSRVGAPVELAAGEEFRAGRTVLALGLARDRAVPPAPPPPGPGRLPGRLLALAGFVLALLAAVAGARVLGV